MKYTETTVHSDWTLQFTLLSDVRLTTDEISPPFKHTFHYSDVGVMESLPLSDAPDQTCCLRGPWGNHLDLLLAGSECETSGSRCSCKGSMGTDQSCCTGEEVFPTLQY